MSKTDTQTVGDLVEVLPIRTVIQLADAGREELHHELLDSFVFTAEVRELFSRLLLALRAPAGLGAFLKGHYGSGKSHCLTFLKLLLEGHPRARALLPEGLPLPERDWLVVSVPLHHFAASSSLEEAVMRCLEEEVARVDGQRPVLSQQRRLLDNFRRYVYPVYAERLPGWSELEEDEAARRALHFLRSLPDNPLDLKYDRRQALESVLHLLRGRGLVLLLDELSEFLRSKTAEAFHEDIRYLQFLGESAEKHALWPVASLQQHLEELGFAEEEGYLRIKERYPLRFSLSARHVADLIEGRLIRRKADAPILKLWQDFQRIYPGVVEEREFLRIYPVHPATLELLETLMTLFSRHRGVVDFVHTRLSGSELKGARGILDEPADRLLTPDSLFDHFRERFSELAHLAPYEQTVFAHVERELPHWFAEPREREIALQAVKLLILLEICPVPMRRTAADLARMLARRISRLNPQVNLQYIQEQILEPLVQKSGFVVRQADEYHLQLKANPAQLLGQRLREKRQSLKVEWEPALALVTNPVFPLSDLVNRKSMESSFLWRHSQRTVEMSLRDLARTGHEEVSAQLRRLEADADAALWVALPALEDDLEETAERLLAAARAQPRSAGLTLWLPQKPDADLADLLLDWRAHRALASEVRGRDQQLTLEGLARELQQRLTQALLELYRHGKVLTVDGKLGTPAHEHSRERLLLAVLRPGQERLYPRFAEVEPRGDQLGKSFLKRYWDEFLHPGQCPRDSSLALAVENVLVPLGLAVREGDEWRLGLAGGGPALEVLDRLLPGQRHSYAELEHRLRKGEFGLMRMQFALVLATLVQLGRVQLFSHGRAYSLAGPQALLEHKAEEVGLAHALDGEQLARLEELQWMVPAGTTPGKTREFWLAAQGRLETMTQLARSVQAGLQRAGAGEEWEELRQAAGRVLAVAESVGQPSVSTTGLARLLQHGAGGLRETEVELQRWERFVQDDLREFLAARARCELFGFSDLLARFERPEPNWRELHRELVERESRHAEHYTHEHQEFYAQPVFRTAKALSEHPEWKAVEALARVLGIEMQPNPAQLRQQLHQLPIPCRRRLDQQLLLGPVCSCGFQPGQEAPEAPPLASRVRAALICGCQSLTQSAAPVETYLRNLHELGRTDLAQRLERVLAVAAEAAQPPPAPNFFTRASEQLLVALDPPAVEALSRALTGQTLVVPRRLEDLLEKLQGQRLPVPRLRQAFEEWLQGPDLRPDSWISLEVEPAAGAGAWLAAWLQQHGLEAPPALRRRFRLEGTPEGEPPEAELKEVMLTLAPGLDPVRAAAQERLFAGMSRWFCQQALGRNLTLPDLPWPHLELARLLTRLWQDAQAQDFETLARARRDWWRARHLDLEAELLTPDLDTALNDALEAAWQSLSLDLPALAEVPRLLAAPYLEGRRLVVVMVDGMRWDLWDLLRGELELGPPLKEILALSPVPSVTRKAREVLLGGHEPSPAGADGMLLGRPLHLLKNADDRRSRARLEELLSGGEPAILLNHTFVDRRRHETTLELWPLYGELLAEARLRLLPTLRKVTPGSVLLVTADHGFTDPGTDAPAHGGARWEERVVPAAVWIR